MRRLVPLLVAVAVAAPLAAQEPVAGDTTRQDSTDVTQLPELNVTVTRTQEPLERVPFAVGVLDRNDISRGQPTIGIDEALNNLPGVVVANRYNFSLDQRISIRGFGSRSNFGVRGLKVLVDGVPQTLPDGQSQLTNVDFADLERAEVLRGASSSLYGNASGGVISLADAAGGRGAVRPADPAAGRRRQARGRRLLQVAELDVGTVGQRERDAVGVAVQGRRIPAAQRGGVPPAQRRRRLDHQRIHLGHGAAQPGRQSRRPRTRARSPAPSTRPTPTPPRPTTSAGARTRTCSSTSSRSACGTSTPAGNEYDVTVFGLLRDLENPLAAPPDIPGGPTNGTYVRIDRNVARHPAQQRARARRGGTGAPADRRRRPPADARRPGEHRVRRRRADGRALPRPAGAGDRAGAVRAAAVERRTTGCWSAAAPASTGSGSAWTTASSPTATTAATARCRR